MNSESTWAAAFPQPWATANLLLALIVTGLGTAALAAPAPDAIPNPKQRTVFVSLHGNDRWSGALPAPNRAETDGPVATLPRALDLTRSLRKHADATKDISLSIQIRSGTYYLEEPLVLRPEDSGLTISGFKNERAFVSGGVSIQGWTAVNKDGRVMWTARVPAQLARKSPFHELWVNGQRAVRARYPDKGYLKVAGLLESGGDWAQGQMRFRAAPGDLQDWKTVTNAEVVVMNRWVESRLPVFSVDEKENVVKFTKRAVFQLDVGDLYYVEGAFEFLDQPGEWYLDSAVGTVYYLPRSGEVLGGCQAIAPLCTQVLRFEGRPEAGQFVEKITVRGLSFGHTEWNFPAGFDSGADKANVWPPPKADVGGFAQAAVGVPGAVWGQGMKNCRFEKCQFSQLGNYALELARGCQRNQILGCEFSDLGAGGIKIGETEIRERAEEQTRENEISNCHIHDGGLTFPSGEGIWIGQSPGNRLEHNLIHDFYYTGISVGWTWGYGPALATNTLVVFNHVHHIGVKSNGDGPILSDMAGIYTLGMQPGTRIFNNLWHDIAGLRYGGWGIYFDEGSSSIVARSNLVYRTTHGGFHQHYGATNRVENNVFAFARDHQIQRSRPEAHVSFSFVTNIVYFDQGVLLGSSWSDDKFQIDWNLFFDIRAGAKAEQMQFEKANLETWHGRGHDQHSIIADPLFVGAKQDDFRLKANSPAFRLGFHPIDLSQVGIRKGKGY